MPPALRKNQKPLVCFVRLYGDEKRRMMKQTRGRRGAHNDIAFDGILAELTRRETQASMTAEESRLATELRRLGGDPETTLRQAIAAMEDPDRYEVGVRGTVVSTHATLATAKARAAGQGDILDVAAGTVLAP